ncbi:MAG TPA: 7-carboxy-7-deazaguanine synthase QueE [Ktedonobacteraceae bacterium]|nr:7-carboxy-7-deazaguanine synthase QueE [Ktedonobacteraceae bacterium]
MMLVMEIYRSIQGEGTLMGVPTTFVRFFACNLRCSWCDTRYSWSVREGGTWRTLSPQMVAQEIEALEARHVVLTGGEPTLQKDLPELAALLKARGYHLTIETNATIVPETLLPLIDLWSLSPKLSSAGENYLRPQALERFLADLRPEQQQWKFVVRDDADEQLLRTLLTGYPAFRERQLALILQPEGDSAQADYPRALECLAERLRDPFWRVYNVRVLPQLHVIIWGRKRLV